MYSWKPKKWIIHRNFDLLTLQLNMNIFLILFILSPTYGYTDTLIFDIYKDHDTLTLNNQKVFSGDYPPLSPKNLTRFSRTADYSNPAQPGHILRLTWISEIFHHKDITIILTFPQYSHASFFVLPRGRLLSVVVGVGITDWPGSCVGVIVGKTGYPNWLGSPPNWLGINGDRIPTNKG